MSQTYDNHASDGEDDEPAWDGARLPVRRDRIDDLQGGNSDLQVFEHVVERIERTFSEDFDSAAHWEGVRSLRTELLLRRAPSSRSDVIAVIGPGKGEGRSVLAADLAVAFAQTGVRTLLVDANLRAPRQHRIFGARRAPGLSDAVVAGEPPLLHAVRGLGALYLLTAGSPADDPLEVLSGQGMSELRAFWNRAFQVVVIDTPAASEFADAMVIATNEECRLLMVTRAQHTRNKDVQRMLKRLSTLPAPIAGAVVNHF